MPIRLRVIEVKAVKSRLHVDSDGAAGIGRWSMTDLLIDLNIPIPVER